MNVIQQIISCLNIYFIVYFLVHSFCLLLKFSLFASISNPAASFVIVILHLKHVFPPHVRSSYLYDIFSS
jgi:hypothetical protein